jgi:hypothetical protein
MICKVYRQSNDQAVCRDHESGNHVASSSVPKPSRKGQSVTVSAHRAIAFDRDFTVTAHCLIEAQSQQPKGHSS